MKVDLEVLKKELQEQVNEKRYLHSLGVASTAKELALKYGENPEKAEVAGILHDIAKFWDAEKLKVYIRTSRELENDLLLYNEELWHGPVASIYVQERFNITDQDIINSIRFHTSGRENMSLLEKIVCLADYIEPMRNFEGIDYIRLLADESIEESLLAALDGTISHLIKSKKKIYPLTLLARNYLLGELYTSKEEF